jgi:hypothetical protein
MVGLDRVMELDYCLKMCVVFYSQVLALRGKNYGSKIMFFFFFFFYIFHAASNSVV